MDQGKDCSAVVLAVDGKYFCKVDFGEFRKSDTNLGRFAIKTQCDETFDLDFSPHYDRYSLSQENSWAPQGFLWHHWGSHTLRFLIMFFEQIF